MFQIGRRVFRRGGKRGRKGAGPQRIEFVNKLRSIAVDEKTIAYFRGIVNGKIKCDSYTKVRWDIWEGVCDRVFGRCVQPLAGADKEGAPTAMMFQFSEKPAEKILKKATDGNS